MKIEITQLPESAVEEKGIRDWPIWEKEISEFPWKYDETEACFILEGEVTVTTDHETVEIKPGDYVVFPRGLECQWNIKSPIRKHYSFE